MDEDVFEKPLTMKDFLREKPEPKRKKSKLYERVKRTPESRRQKKQSKYFELVNAIAKEKRGTYKVLLNSIKEDLAPKSAYPSIERVLMKMAKQDGVDFATTTRRQVQTKNGLRTYVSHPAYVKWKEDNIRLKIINNELFIEKRTDRPL